MFKKIKKLSNSKDVKVLIENLLSLTALQLISYVVPFLTLPYLARIIGVEKFGILAFASSIIIFLQTFTDYGFNFTAVRDIAKNRDNSRSISKIFCSVMVARILLMTISLMILICLIIFIPQLKEYRIVLLLTFLSIPGYVMFPEWFFQAMEKMKYITIMNVFSKLIFTLLIFVVVKEEKDYLYIPILTALGFLVSGAISLLYVFKKFQINWVSPNFREIKNLIGNSTNMFISLILPNLYTSMSVIFLQSFGGKLATGLFDGGNKFVGISQRLTNVISRAFFPFLARRIDKHNLYEIVSFFFSLIISIVLFFGAELIISVFLTPEFNESVTILKIMAISPVFLFMMNVYGTNYLVLINRENVLKNIIVGCSIFGLLLSFFAIKNYSYKGAAVAIVVVWGLRGILTMYFAKKLKYENIQV